MKLISLLVLLGTLVVPLANAGDSLVFSGLSYHPAWRTYTYEGTTHPMNEINIGIGFQRDDVRWCIVNNSYGKWSVVSLWVPSWELTDSISVGARLGGATGYSRTPVDMPIAPIVGLEADIRFDRIHLVPAWQAPGVWTFHIQVDY